MIDASAFQWLLTLLTRWLNRRERDGHDRRDLPQPSTAQSIRAHGESAAILVGQPQASVIQLAAKPYSSRVMVELWSDCPTVMSPQKLYLSITTDLPTIRYKGEIVGWDDKRQLTRGRWKAIERLLWTLQPTEGGLYDMSSAANGQSVNLLHVWRLQRLDQPFSVNQLAKFFGGGQVSPKRTTAGGWTYLKGVLP